MNFFKNLETAKMKIHPFMRILIGVILMAMFYFVGNWYVQRIMDPNIYHNTTNKPADSHLPKGNIDKRREEALKMKEIAERAKNIINYEQGK